jgi:hypothetical protein
MLGHLLITSFFTVNGYVFLLKRVRNNIQLGSVALMFATKSKYRNYIQLGSVTYVCNKIIVYRKLLVAS